MWRMKAVEKASWRWKGRKVSGVWKGGVSGGFGWSVGWDGEEGLDSGGQTRLT